MRHARWILAALLTLPAPASRAATSLEWCTPIPQGNPIRGTAFESATLGYAVGREGTVLRTADGGATWVDLTDWSALTADLNDVLVLGPGTLLAVGASPYILRSEDGGGSWTPVANPAAAELRNLGWAGSALVAVGAGGTVLRSTDAGQSWSVRTSPGPSDLVDQAWLDAQNGIVLGQFLVRRTTDGGATWAPLPGVIENWFAPGDVHWPDPLNAWVLVDFTTLRTTNGGTTWFEKHGGFAEGPIYQQEAAFVDANTRYVTTEAEGAEVWRTNDDGLHWTLLYSRNRTTGYPDIERLPDGTLVVVSTDGDLVWSADQGASWTNFTVSPGGGDRDALEPISLLPSGRGFTGGLYGSWLETTDGGATWHLPAARPNLTDVMAIATRDDAFLLAGGIRVHGTSDVQRSTDGGASWTSHLLSAGYTGYAVDLEALPGGTCFAAAYGGNNLNFVYRSTDDGNTWHLRSGGLPVNRRFECIQFLNATTGFLGGGEFGIPGLWRTTDGGGLWSVVTPAGLPVGRVDDLHWFDAAVGLILGDGQVYRTTNAGASWVLAAQGLGRDLDFFDGARGAATGSFSGPRSVFRTADAGVTWQQQILPLEPILADVVALADGFLVTASSSVVFAGRDATTSVAEPGIDTVTEAPLWPNPVRAGWSGAVTLALPSATRDAVTLRLYSIEGRQIAGTTASTLRDQRSVASPAGWFEHLVPGVYVLWASTRSGDGTSGRLVVTRAR